MDMKLEVVVLPVADVDRAEHFYKALGWRLDAAPGSAQGLHLVVADIEAARAELAGRGVRVSEVFHDAGGVVDLVTALASTHQRLSRHRERDGDLHRDRGPNPGDVPKAPAAAGSVCITTPATPTPSPPAPTG